MRSALYYPHTQMRDEAFLKNSLLLWDEVEFIAPSRYFAFDQDLPPHIREALELLCRPHMPSETEKKRAHSRIVKLLKNGVPPWLITTEVPDSIEGGRKVREFYGNEFGIYPEKLDHKTWTLLEAAGLVRLKGNDYDYYSRPLVGLYLMSLLANVCAGTTREQITDRAEAYAFLWRLTSAEAGAQFLSPKAEGSKESLDRLVTISLKAINTNDIPFGNILELRKREARESGSDYRAFRLKYGQMLKQSAMDIAKSARTPSDRREIERQFELEIKDDLASLKAELGVAKRKILLSKELLTTVAVSAVSLMEPFSAAVALPGKIVAGFATAQALAKDLWALGGDYSKALHGHSTSWLYLAQNPGIRDLPIRHLGGK